MAKTVLLQDAAAILGVSRRTIYYRIRDGRLQTIRTSGGSQRVLVESLEMLLRQQVAGALVRGPGVGVSDTDLSERSPAT